MPEEKVDVRVHVAGVVLPGWTIVVLALCLVFAAAGCLVTYGQLRVTAREIRILQLHCQDIESVLIRSGAAKRSDFAPWTSGTAGARERADPVPDSDMESDP